MQNLIRGIISAFDIFGALRPKRLVWCKNCGHMICDELPPCCKNPESEQILGK